MVKNRISLTDRASNPDQLEAEIEEKLSARGWRGVSVTVTDPDTLEMKITLEAEDERLGNEAQNG